MVVKCRVFPPICQSEEADKPLCFLHHLSVSLLCSSLLSMAACLIISALNHLCETGQREKGFFFLVFPLFSHVSTHSYFCFGPSRLSSSLHLHPPLRLLNPESLPLSILVSFCASQWNYIFNWNPGVFADVRNPALKRVLTSSPDAFATPCDVFVMWSDQDGVRHHAEAKWWVHHEKTTKRLLTW